jgi:hypothetical protein
MLVLCQQPVNVPTRVDLISQHIYIKDVICGDSTLSLTGLHSYVISTLVNYAGIGVFLQASRGSSAWVAQRVVDSCPLKPMYFPPTIHCFWLTLVHPAQVSSSPQSLTSFRPTWKSVVCHTRCNQALYSLVSGCRNQAPATRCVPIPSTSSAPATESRPLSFKARMVDPMILNTTS